MFRDEFTHKTLVTTHTHTHTHYRNTTTNRRSRSDRGASDPSESMAASRSFLRFPSVSGLGRATSMNLIPMMGSFRLKSTVPSPSPLAEEGNPDFVSKPVESQAAKILGCPVNSHNEFDPLREVIVGCVADATIPEWHVSGKAVWPSKHWDMFRNNAGKSFPAELMTKAAEELDGFARILEAEGVTVRRPGKFSLLKKQGCPFKVLYGRRLTTDLPLTHVLCLYFNVD